jgi:hypothetical protein
MKGASASVRKKSRATLSADKCDSVHPRGAPAVIVKASRLRMAITANEARGGAPQRGPRRGKKGCRPALPSRCLHVRESSNRPPCADLHALLANTYRTCVGRGSFVFSSDWRRVFSSIAARGGRGCLKLLGPWVLLWPNSCPFLLRAVYPYLAVYQLLPLLAATTTAAFSLSSFANDFAN